MNSPFARRSYRRMLVAVFSALLAGLSFAHGDAASLPAHFEILEVDQFDKPVGLVFAADGTMFVASKKGRVFVHDGVAKQGPAFIDLRDEICQTGDRGLLGIALHPGFVADGGATSWVYLLFTVSPVFGEDPQFSDDDKYSFGRLVRYRAIPSGSNILADAGTRETLLGNQLPDGTVPDGIPNIHSSHSNGTLVFGTDGSLLITTGDGAHFDQMDVGGLDVGAFENFTHPVTGLKGPFSVDQDCGAFRAQDLRSLSGKVLRIDPETGFGYPSNPYWNGDGASHTSRIWAIGLRNAYRAGLVPGTGSLDPALGDPGALLVGDVGWQDWEEVNLCVGGENFGWPCFEGPFPETSYDGFEFNPNPFGFPDCANPGPGVSTGALTSWNHDDAGGMTPPGVHVDEFGTPLNGFIGSCVIGGAFYTGTDYPVEYQGRYFFGDYADDWIRTAVIDPVTGVTEIADFAFDVDYLVDLEAHPITGEIYFCAAGQAASEGRVKRIRFGANLTPVAQFTADPLFGDAPLLVSFDAGGSSDPENDTLTFDWDFGDGFQGSGETVQHTYNSDGLFIATLTVTDEGGLSDTETVQIASGNVPPLVRILAPLPGDLFVTPQQLDLVSTGTDFSGENLSYEWTVDLYHDTHVHPENVVLPGQNASYGISPHGEVDELYYLRVEVKATNESGLSSTDHLFVYPIENVVDRSGTSLPISRMDELIPPNPTGNGNLDIEVVRDGDFPPVGSSDRQRQFDTFHNGAQGDDDWIGYELSYVPGDTVRFTSLLFQEGVHYSAGGWFESFTVEVRDGGVWTEAPNLRVLPDYPFHLATTPGFDGVNYQTYELHFDPTVGDAVRLRGDPGGADGYISVGELRARMISPVPVFEPWRDVTEGAEVLAKVFELSPPFPLGEGSLSALVVFNETYPPVGSQSKFAQVDMFHNGDQAGEDYVGYSFDDWRLLGRVVFQEGFHYPGGGWFDTLAVEVRDDDTSPWEPVTSLVVQPSLPADTSAFGTYETFEIVFDPVVAREIRLVGDPGGIDEFISVGELRVFEPGIDESTCGWMPYGEGAGGNNILTLTSPTAPILAAPNVLEASGAPGPGPGWLTVGAGQLTLPLVGGTLLVDLTGGLLDPISYAADGRSTLHFTLPSNPAFVGQTFYLQALGTDPGLPGQLLFSNGLQLTICP